MVKNSKQKGHHRFATDDMMKKLFGNLYSDFKDYLEAPEDHDAVKLIGSDMAKFRDHKWDRKRLNRPIGCMKRSYQLESLFKRYIFLHDKFSNQQLVELTERKFIQTQERIAAPKELTFRASRVIAAARKHVRRILGEYDPDEHMEACRFGNNAAVGHPSTRRYLDLKASGPLTGSAEHIAWFKSQLKLQKNYLLRDMLIESNPAKDLDDRYVLCDSLKLTNVEKTFKARRSIMANTLLGGFYTYGLGKVMQHRLVGEGLNIRYLQKRHRRMVLAMSKSLRLVTADLSSASDSFTIALVMALLPRKWWQVVNLGRISKVEINNKLYRLESFMTMGIGFTFQLQTLLFYCLLRGVEDCLGKRGFVSVYGDDLIYRTEIHPYVNQIFNDLGFLLNEDKTFVKESFRESCGADAYCGCDVRPFQPEGQSQLLSRKRYVCLLYKTVNGLLERWKPFEIPKTLNFLYSEILSIDPHLLQVPMKFPAYAGVRTSMIQGASPWLPPIWKVPEIAGRYQNLCFLAYCQVPETRPVTGMYIYYWNKLRTSSSCYGLDSFDPYDKTESLIWKQTKASLKEHFVLPNGTVIRHKLKAYVSVDRYNIIRQQCHAHAWSEDSNE